MAETKNTEKQNIEIQKEEEKEKMESVRKADAAVKSMHDFTSPEVLYQDLYFCVPIFLLFCKIISDHDLQSLSSLISVDFRIICYSNRTAVFHFIYKFIRFSEIDRFYHTARAV